MSLICYKGEAPQPPLNFKEDLSRRFYEGTSLDPSKASSEHESLGELVRSIMKVPVPDVLLKPVSKQRIAESLFMTQHGMQEERMALQRSANQASKHSDNASVHYSQTYEQPGGRSLHAIDSQMNPARLSKMTRYQ